MSDYNVLLVYRNVLRRLLEVSPYQNYLFSNGIKLSGKAQGACGSLAVGK